MIGLKYKDEFLDVDPRASIAWELNNLIFSSTDNTKLPGSFSFPFNLPATASNRARLNYPDRIDNATPFVANAPVQVCVAGKELFPATLKVTQAGPTEIRCNLVANPLSTLKQIRLDELDLGGDRTFGSAAGLKAHAANTADAPLDYDYVFFPVYNLGFLEHESSEQQRWMNWYNAEDQEFQPSTDAPGFMPFVRLEYLLDRMFAGESYVFENRWQITDEQRSIVLYNHRTLFNNAALELTLNLRNHVPKTKSTELLKVIMSDFALGLFYNPWSSTLRLIPLNDLITRVPAHDWTHALLAGPFVQHDNSTTPVRFAFKEPADKSRERYSKFGKPAVVVGTVADMPALDATSTEGYYYVTSEAQYWRRVIGAGGPRVLQYGDFYSVPVEEGDPVFETDGAPLLDLHVPFVHSQATPDTWMLRAPVIEAPGTIKYSYLDDVGDPVPVTQSNDNPLRFTVYRGMAFGSPYAGYQDYAVPYASASPYGPGSGVYGTMSLRWDGEYGLYARQWKRWHNMLLRAKTVTARLSLSLVDLIEFNFEHKVRIQNMDYLVKSLKVSITPAGLSPVEAELVSVI